MNCGYRAAGVAVSSSRVGVAMMVVIQTQSEVPVAGGKDTAEAIPGVQLMLIEGMGHDLPHGGAWPRIIEAIAVHTRKASG